MSKPARSWAATDRTSVEATPILFDANPRAATNTNLPLLEGSTTSTWPTPTTSAQGPRLVAQTVATATPETCNASDTVSGLVSLAVRPRTATWTAIPIPMTTATTAQLLITRLLGCRAESKGRFDLNSMFRRSARPATSDYSLRRAASSYLNSVPILHESGRHPPPRSARRGEDRATDGEAGGTVAWVDRGARFLALTVGVRSDRCGEFIESGRDA